MQLWQAASNYGGNDYSDYYVIHSIHRDSDILANHNHDVFWRILSAKERELDGDALIKPSFGHWAVGWLETIMLHRDAPPELLALAEQLLDQYEQYPVLEEDEYSEKVWRAMHEYWAELSLKERVEMCSENGANIFAARHTAYFPEELDELLTRIVEE